MEADMRALQARNKTLQVCNLCLALAPVHGLLVVLHVSVLQNWHCIAGSMVTGLGPVQAEVEQLLADKNRLLQQVEEIMQEALDMEGQLKAKEREMEMLRNAKEREKLTTRQEEDAWHKDKVQVSSRASLQARMDATRARCVCWSCLQQLRGGL